MRLQHLLAAFVLAAPAAALADTAIGGSVGSARVNEGDFEGSDTGWKAFIGSYGALFGGEIAYVNFGELGGGPNPPEAKAWAPSLSLGVPLGLARIYGKLGVAFPEIEGAAVEDEFEQEEAFYGVGMRVGAPAGLGFRLEYERFDFGGNDVDLASAGLEFRFGAMTRPATSSTSSTTSTTTTTTTTPPSTTTTTTQP